MSSFRFIFLFLISWSGCQTTHEPSSVSVQSQSLWSGRLHQSVQKLLKSESGIYGLYVKRLSDGSEYHYNSDEVFYYASAIKFFVLIEAYLQEQEGKFDLQQLHRLRSTDYRDGSGETKWSKPGKKISYQKLVERMMIKSDNTATDILIGRLGAENINDRISQLVGEDVYPITSLLEVRQLMYGELDPRGHQLSASDYLWIRKQWGAVKRLKRFEKKVSSGKSYTVKQWKAAAERYYTKGLNSGTLRAYGKLLEMVAKEQVLGRDVSRRILSLMSRSKTGKRRLRKGFPARISLAHKTGTQYRRVCHMAIGGSKPKYDVIVTTCAKNFNSRKRAEKKIAGFARAIYQSGVFNRD